MTTNSIRIIATAVALVLAAGAGAKSPKRGVAENQFQLEVQMTPLEPGVSWYYNWGNSPGTGYQNQVINYEGFEFVPMAWNGINATALRNYCATHPNVKYILGFNEPNFTDQANMTPQQAAEKWPQIVELAHELGLEIVAPALNYSTGKYSQPTTWMDEFVALVGPDAFDYTALHCYGGLSVMKDMVTTFYERYGKPVWMTEWCYWPGGAGDVYVNPTVQLASLIECVEWLEKSPCVFRYSWFKAVGPHDSPNKPNYGLEITTSGQGPRELSPQGWAYTYMTDFNPDVWNAINTTVAATEYITSYNILIGKGENPACPRPIELSQFNVGAYTDYQFDVPADGKYYFCISACGDGEPIRFDPKLAVSVLDTDAQPGVSSEPKSFALPNSTTSYVNVDFEIEVPAGHQTIRLYDANPYQPSGVRISTVSLNTAPAGVNAIITDDSSVDVYNLQGIRLRHSLSPSSALDGLPAGIYIAGGRKVVVR